ncbi:hypothetical protein ROSMUCSMR3_02920 [Roseovarius mucosus]|uniref:Uncharacterized protein n=1 Tax=Roseovarius mucosus TaxID=215743 RepID=A0A1V0RRH7_9RHOB|nr:hypothetical protein [Roseovarius mucosus]ARE84387.1 hypothetical protein ROSMUCSMR3_02920 [Roseovarius mucosus]
MDKPEINVKSKIMYDAIMNGYTQPEIIIDTSGSVEKLKKFNTPRVVFEYEDCNDKYVFELRYYMVFDDSYNVERRLFVNGELIRVRSDNPLSSVQSITLSIQENMRYVLEKNEEINEILEQKRINDIEKIFKAINDDEADFRIEIHYSSNDVDGTCAEVVYEFDDIELRLQALSNGKNYEDEDEEEEEEEEEEVTYDDLDWNKVDPIWVNGDSLSNRNMDIDLDIDWDELLDLIREELDEYHANK